ncbi:MAG: AMP-binding protein [Acidimicrobiia bacterium]|nr:AMP-binding protein [Acidimicrobiia bacterium]
MTVVEERAGAVPRAGEPSSLPALLLGHAARRPEALALRHKRLGLWQEVSWSEYATRSAQVGLGLLALGVEPGDRVAVHSENRPEWCYADLGIQGIGAVTVGIYPTSPAAEVEYLVGHSESVVLVVEDEEQLDKALEVRDRLPRLRKIVVIDTRGVKNLDDELLMTFEELEALGAAHDPAEWAERAAGVAAEDVAVIVYTSGTTGPPKGAMLSQANLLAMGLMLSDALASRPEDEVLSYLPLCHVAERLVSVVVALTAGYVVNFGEGGDAFANDLREVQPTVFVGVPRVWEKMLAAVRIRVESSTWLKRRLFDLWLRRGARVAARRRSGRAGPVDAAVGFLAWLSVFRTLRRKLGLGRVRLALSGAAPIAPQVLELFWAVGVPVLEVYGQTECSGVATMMPSDDVRLGTVGTALPGVEVRTGELGEILVRSEAVFVGYFRNEEATREAVDPEGWLHTGDVGELDADGYLVITDRMKDIIVTAGGKNVSPQFIENLLKVSPFVREAIVVGDRRPYLTALIGIEVDTVGEWSGRHGVPFTTYRDLSEKPEVRELIGEWVAEVNRDLARAEEIKRFELLPVELDHDEGQLTATQKVKRRAIAQQFSELIERMYR